MLSTNHRESLDGLKIVRSYDRGSVEGRIHCGDALTFLRSLKHGSASIVFLDPPFNLGKIYDEKLGNLDRQPEEQYWKWLQDILEECVKVLMPGGALYLYHLPKWAMRVGVRLNEDLHFQNWIAISMKNGFVRGQHLYPAHYALLYFTKGNPTHFHRPKIHPAVCRHCGDLIRDYGGYRTIIEEKGLNLSDFWDDLSPVRHRNRKHRAANELPEILFERVTAISGAPGLLYVDPFAGAGSGVIAAVRGGLRFEACDLIVANCLTICSRLDKLTGHDVEGEVKP